MAGVFLSLTKIVAYYLSSEILEKKNDNEIELSIKEKTL